jgi:hypothetical protein
VPKLAPLKATGDANLNFTVAEEKPAAKNNNAKTQPTKSTSDKPKEPVKKE